MLIKVTLRNNESAYINPNLVSALIPYDNESTGIYLTDCDCSVNVIGDIDEIANKINISVNKEGCSE